MALLRGNHEFHGSLKPFSISNFQEALDLLYEMECESTRNINSNCFDLETRAKCILFVKKDAHQRRLELISCAIATYGSDAVSLLSRSRGDAS